MALQFIPIGAFLGSDENVPSLQLAHAFSSSGNHNTYLNKLGQIATIGGYVRLNLAAVLSFSGLPMICRALYEYGSQSSIAFQGTGFNRQILGVFDTGPGNSEWEIHVSNDMGATWQRVLNLARPANVDARVDFAQLGTVLVMTNNFGIYPVYTWDGGSFIPVSNTQLAAPIVTGAGNNTGLLSGNYQWKIVPIKSDKTRKLASVPSAVTSLQIAKATVTWVNDPDPTVVSYEVYRTTGTGAVYYFEGAVTSAATFTSNTPDLELINNRALAEYGEAPPVGVAVCEAHLQRLWYGVLPSSPRAWLYSDPGLPNSVPGINLFDFTDAESFTDQCVGGVGNFNRMFVAFLERSIWTVSGTGQFNGAIIDFNRRRTNAVTGAVSGKAVAAVPIGSKYRNATDNVVTTESAMLAYLTPRLDIRLFNGDSDTIISFPKSVTLKRLNYAQRRKAYAVVDKAHGEITWVFPHDLNTEPSYAVSWNYLYGTWDDRDWPFGAIIEGDSDSESSVMLAGTGAYDGAVYRLWQGTTFNGQPFTSRLITTTLYGAGANITEPTLQGQPLFSLDKRWRWVDFLMKIAGLTSVTIDWLPTEAGDDDLAWSTQSVVNGFNYLVTSDGQKILTSDGQMILTPNEVMRPSRAYANRSLAGLGSTGDTFTDGSANPRYLTSRGVRIRLTCLSSSGGFVAMGANVAYQLLTGFKRPFVR